VKVFFYN